MKDERIDLASLRRLLAGGTGGPWRHGSVETDAVFVPHPEGLAGPGGERVLLRMNRHFPHAEDAALIVAAVNALPALLSELEAAREVVSAASDLRAQVENGPIAANPCDRLFASLRAYDARGRK